MRLRFIIGMMLIPVFFTSCTKSLPTIPSPTPSKPLQPDSIRPTQLSRRQEQQDHNEQSPPPAITPRPIHKSEIEKKDQEGGTKQTIAAHTSTNDNDETVIINVTTVVVVAAGGSTPNPDNQVLHTPVSAAVPGDQNEETTFENQLQDDQEALHRTALILALVGGLIGIAIVASIVIFTKMRVRKRKLSKEHQDENLVGSSSVGDDERDTGNDDDNDDDDDSENSNGHNNSDLGSSSPEAQRQRPLTHNNNDDPPLTLQPSAPPPDEQPPHDPVIGTNQRRVVSIGSQMAPAPSAPTAKELDAANNSNNDYSNMPVLYPMRPPNIEGSSSATTSHHQRPDQRSSSSSTCPHCFEHTPSAPPVPEMPPPAYTPTAPPLYALPPIPDHTCHHQAPPSSSTSSISSTTNTANDLLLPSSRNTTS